jgi:hypothetical protein
MHSCALTVALAVAGAPWAAERTAVDIHRGSPAQEYVLNGIDAWSEAKKRGFTFQPLAYAPEQWVTVPPDGVNTLLQTRTRSLLGREETLTLAEVVGGNASVSPPARGSRSVVFEFFGGRTLAPGWSVVGVAMDGSFRMERAPVAGSRDPSVRVRATASASTTGRASVRTLTLLGPASAVWTDAFAR